MRGSVSGQVFEHFRREALATLLAAVLLAAAWVLGWLVPLERAAGDLLLRFPRPSGPAQSPFTAVLIDDRSVARYGSWPWPRDRLATLIDDIWRQGARGVVVDVVLSGRSDPERDRALAQVLAGRPVILAAALTGDGDWLLPLDDFGGLAVAAHAHAEVASDGVVRLVAETKQASGLSLPAIAIAAARLAGWKGTISPGALLRPDFREPPRSIAQLSAVDLIEGTIDPRLLADRVVLVGCSATGSADQLFVPVGDRHRPTPGVLVHAAAASSVFRGARLRTLRLAWVLVLVLATCTPLQIGRSRAGRLHPSAPALAVAGALVAAPLALWALHVIVPVVTLVAAIALSAVLREVEESLEAQRLAGDLLASMLHAQGSKQPQKVPAGVRGRLGMIRELQEQLARDRDRRHTLLESLDEGVMLWDANDELVAANPAVTRLWGHPPSRAEVMNLIRVREGSDALTVAGEISRGGRALELSVRPVRGGSLGVLRDITARRELDRKRVEMQRMVSHELRTPLASIAGFGSMLESYTLDADELARVAGLVRSEAERLGDMVSTFLDLERLGSGRWDDQLTTVDLAALVKDRCQVLGAAYPEIEIRLDLDAECSIEGLSTLLVRLIDNLVGNALKFSPEGSRVEVTVHSSGTTSVFSVTDHGPGIPDHAFPHLFERFYRVPGAGPRGSGLGLALVREVAEWHGASVEVASTVGRGSRLTVRFPHTRQYDPCEAHQ